MPEDDVRSAPPARDYGLGGNDEIDRFGALALLIRLDIEADALPLDQRLQPGAFHGGDMHEHVAPSVVWLDEPIAALAVKKLDRTGHCHRATPSPRLLRRRPPRRDGLARHPHGQGFGREQPKVTPPAPTGGGTSKPARVN